MFKSITIKLFIITTAVIMAFISVMLLIQLTFFADYYINQKTQSVEKYTEELVKFYSSVDDKLGLEALCKLNKYSDDYDLTIYYIDHSSLGYSSTNNATFCMISPSQESKQSNLNNFFQEQINHGNNLYLKNKASLDAGKNMTYTVKDTYGNTNVITVSSIITNGKSEGLLYLFSSLQSVSEAAGVIKNYNAIFFIGATVIILALSFLFSKQITKPLIHLDKVASGIANLDFSQECTIKSRDELGNLSKTINLLSANLCSTLAEQKETNEKLACEIAKQKELEDMRKLFVAGVSHELKTPISVIRGYTEGILDGIEKGSIKKEYANIIQHETEKMSRIVSDMLDLAQMETGKYELSIIPLSINRMIKYQLKKFSPMLESKKIRLNADLPNENILVLGDSMRIEQVLVNLLSNAVSYTPVGGDVIITVLKTETNISFEIENSCHEISKQELCRIWDDFYRIDKSRSREFGGTGLGLTVVKNILELHASKYGVKTTEMGIKFYFTLDKCSETDDPLSVRLDV